MSSATTNGDGLERSKVGWADRSSMEKAGFRIRKASKGGVVVWLCGVMSVVERTAATSGSGL